MRQVEAPFFGKVDSKVTHNTNASVHNALSILDYYYYTPVRVDDGTVQKLHLFYLISHLRLDPSNLFYHVPPLFSCLCFGPQCLKIS